MAKESARRSIRSLSEESLSILQRRLKETLNNLQSPGIPYNDVLSKYGFSLSDKTDMYMTVFENDEGWSIVVPSGGVHTLTDPSGREVESLASPTSSEMAAILSSYLKEK